MSYGLFQELSLEECKTVRAGSESTTDAVLAEVPSFNTVRGGGIISGILNTLADISEKCGL